MKAGLYSSSKQSPSFTRKVEEGGGGGVNKGNSFIWVAGIQHALWDTETSQFCRERPLDGVNVTRP